MILNGTKQYENHTIRFIAKRYLVTNDLRFLFKLQRIEQRNIERQRQQFRDAIPLILEVIKDIANSTHSGHTLRSP